MKRIAKLNGSRSAGGWPLLIYRLKSAACALTHHGCLRALLLTAAAFMTTAAAPALSASVVLHHVHGLAFTPDGKSLIVPAHTGLAVYRDGQWQPAPGPAHDFMGFSMARKAIYSSGHPAPGTPLRNPLGLVKSTDGGITGEQLALSGESDFHLMSASYASSAVYVVNADANSKMPHTGVYLTQDDGKSWRRGAGAGLSGQITSIAAHPASPATVAVGTLNALYLSQDSAATFKRLGTAAPITAVSFDTAGKHLYYATDKADTLHGAALDGGAKPSLRVPVRAGDFVTYIARNPSHFSELAIATRQRDVYLSRDGGSTWQQLARQGEGVPQGATRRTR